MFFMLVIYFILNFCIFNKYTVWGASNSFTTDNYVELKEVVKELDDVEKIYIEYMFQTENKKDSICSLTKSRKIALCERIFNQRYFKKIKIYSNKVAFFTNSLKCEKKSLVMHTRLFFLDEIIPQEMYPCYGRHDTVRTNYVTDDYFDKFYVSSGLVNDSIMVYIHEFNFEYDWFSVYNYIEDIQLNTLSPVLITIEEVKYELQLNKNITLTNDPTEIETIYLREKENARSKDEICELEKRMKIALCKTVFDTCKDNIKLHRINMSAFAAFNPECVRRRLEIRSFEELKNRIFSEQMFTCFSRKTIRSTNDVTQDAIRNFAISKGPRENSINLYLRLKHYSRIQYYLISLVENVYIQELKPFIIVFKDIQTESVQSKAVLEKKASLTQIWTTTIQMNFDFINNITTEAIDKYYTNTKQLKWNTLNKKKMKVIENIIAKLRINISFILYDEFIIKDIAKNPDIKESMIFDDIKMIKKIQEKLKTTEKIMSVYNHNNDNNETNFYQEKLRISYEKITTKINQILGIQT